MPLRYIFPLFILSGLVFAAERQRGVEFTGLDELENEEIQRECGKENIIPSKSIKKVLYGKEVTSEEVNQAASWAASIATYGPIKANGDIDAGGCSGVLISRWHVLTSAHCLGANEDKTVCGAEGTFAHNAGFQRAEISKIIVRVYSRFGLRDAKDGGRKYEVKRVIFPASWTIGLTCKSFNGDIEDIAIYELKNPVAYPSFVCLANVPLPFKTLTNYGYGSIGLNEAKLRDEPYTLQKQKIKIVDCRPYFTSFNGMTCFTHASESKITSACHGDSGGPIIGRYYDRAFTVGVLMAGYPDCPIIRYIGMNSTTKSTNIMVSVPYYKDWICKWTGICVYGANPMKDKRPTRVWDYTGDKTLFKY